MSASESVVKDDFPPVSYEAWRALAEADLQGGTFEQKLVTHTYEGIDIQPVYCRRDRPGVDDPHGFPGQPPFIRGTRPFAAALSGWDLRQEHAHPDLAATNQAIREDVGGGVTSLLLRLDAAACHGLDPDDPHAAEWSGVDGIMAFHVDDLDTALAGVELGHVGVALDAGAAFLPAAAMLIALWDRREVPRTAVRGALYADPLAVLAREGRLPVAVPTALAQLTDLARWTAGHLPHVTAVGVDTSPYHHAGATAAQDIAFAVATAVEYLRAMTAASMGVDAAARQMVFRISLGTHHFLTIAKLRALRSLWSRVIEVAGASPEAAAMRIHARTSRRVLTQRDPYVNLLRNTVAMFAAGVGGVDILTSVPFDCMVGLPDSFSRRVARNTVLILQEEAHLNRVIDPSGGSWFLDTLTDQLAEVSWKVFQDVEREGGMHAALRSGWVARQIDAAFAPRAKDIARRKEGITGVSEFPDVREQRIVHPVPNAEELRTAAASRLAHLRPHPAVAGEGGHVDHHPSGWTASVIEAAAQGATIGQMSRALGFHETSAEMPPIELRSFAEPFEELRDASDLWCARQGHRPAVFLANMGPVAHHTARATYAKNFFEAGGFEVIGNDGFREPEVAVQAFTASGAGLAVICSSDKLYPDVVPQLASRLKAAGARQVILAGNPGANEATWRAAGVDRFIFVKCDVLATLRELLRAEGVFAS
ncbi:MAG: methylmalonyl-CoA mutase family protein [Pirellulaceae bacterium]